MIQFRILYGIELIILYPKTVFISPCSIINLLLYSAIADRKSFNPLMALLVGLLSKSMNFSFFGLLIFPFILFLAFLCFVFLFNGLLIFKSLRSLSNAVSSASKACLDSKSTFESLLKRWSYLESNLLNPVGSIERCDHCHRGELPSHYSSQRFTLIL